MMQQSKEELVAFLEERYQRYEEVLKNGCKDPSNTDGINLHLICNHISIGKQTIEETLNVEEYPEIYYRPDPKRVPMDYMAKADDIRILARDMFLKVRDYEHLEELRNATFYLSKDELRETGISFYVNLVDALEKYIQQDQLVDMRRIINNQSNLVETLEDCYQKLQAIKEQSMEEEKQLSLFEMM